MATSETITPTLGAAPVTLQAGDYSAIDDRRFWGSGVREGVVSGGSYQVIQRAAGANMTVDVTSSVGSGAVVQGDSVTAQGNYFVPPTAANVNVDIAAADATNPRNDLVVLEVKDDQHDAGGLNLARVRVITGTPNASAVGTDAPGANGTPALPSSCLLLALVRVTAAASSVTTAMINDRRPWAGGVPTYETALPSVAADGQEIYYRAVTADGVIWHLRFRNVFNGGSATYPWEYVGGGSHSAEVATSATRNAAAAYADPNTGSAGPSVTLPLKGEYFVEIGMEAFSATNLGQLQMSYDIGATGAVDGDAIQIQQAFGDQSIRASVAAKRRKTFAAASALAVKYKATTGTCTFQQRYITVTPVRVG
jgi:hypothetical protein